MTEQTLWTGRASWSTLITFGNIVLGLLTGGFWLIVPILKLLSTSYTLTEESFEVTKGVIRKQFDQVDLYRVKDVRMVKGLFSGSIQIISTDKSDPVLNIKGVSDPAALRQKIRAAVQMSKEKKGVRMTEHI